jgi:hypothetical protein
VAKLVPEINAWYHDARDDELFEVVAVDEQEGTIEIQYLNGDIGEFDRDIWAQMVILRAEPPEDWRAPYEMSDDDQLEDSSAFSVSNWDDPQANVDPDGAPNFDDE